MADFDLLIVGGGLATARAVKAFREAGADGSVAVVSKDRWVPYHRPPLSKRYLRGEQEREAAFVEQPGFYDEQRVELLLETTVERVLPAQHRVELAGGRALSYGRLLLASGAWPRQLPVPGGDLDGVLTLRTIDNSTAIREAAEAGRQAVVVGAGFIGMEVSASLRELDVAVAQVHRGSGLFDQFGCAELSEFLVELYRTNGVELFLEDEASRLRGNGRVDAVETKGGELLEADFVVAGVGVDPQTAFLDGSGIEVSNGIVVDDRFRTSAPDALAGDGEGRFDTVSTFFTEVFGTTFKVFGDITRSDEITTRGSFADGKAIAYYLDGGRLVGALLTGQDEETEQQLKDAIAARGGIPAGLAAG